MSDRDLRSSASFEGRTAGEIRIGARLSEDALGVRHRGTDARLLRSLSVRVLSGAGPTDIARIARTARVAHPGLAAVLDVRALSGHAIVASAWIDGETLDARCARGAMDAAFARAIARDLARALAALHGDGAVHGALDASRVIIADDARVVLVDAGLADGSVAEDLRALGRVVTLMQGALARDDARLTAIAESLRFATDDVPARGARGIAERLDAAAPSGAPSRWRGARYPLAAAGVIAALVAGLSLLDGPLRGVRRTAVAVLPFAPLDARDGDASMGRDFGSLVRDTLLSSRRVRPVAAMSLDAGAGDGGAGSDPRAWFESGARLVVSGAIEEAGARVRAHVDIALADGPRASHVVEATDLEDLARDVAGVIEAQASGERTAEIVAPDPSAPPLDEDDRRAFLRGAAFTRALRLQEAIALLEGVTARNPDAIEPRIALVRALATAGYERRARESARSLMTLAAGRSLSSDVLLEARAAEAGAAGRAAEEARVLGVLASRAPDDGARALRLAYGLHKTDQVEAALAAVARAQDEPLAGVLEAHLLVERGEIDAAQTALARAQQNAEALGLDAVRAQARQAAGAIAIESDAPDAALAAYREAASLFRASGLPALAARADVLVGDVQLREGRIREARDEYERARDVLQRAGAFRLLVEADANLGAALYLAGAFDDAEALLRRALDDAAKLENESLAAEPAVNLANLLNYTARPEEAAAFAMRARHAASESRRPDIAFMASIALAASEAQRGGWATAATVYRSLIDRERGPGGSGEREAYAWVALADLLLDRGDAREALDAADRSVALNRARKARVDLGYALATKAGALAALGRTTEARATIGEARRIARDGGGGLADLEARLGAIEANLR